jgi:hypothetical protein
MATSNSNVKVYGFTPQPLLTIFNQPKVSVVPPAYKNKYEIGTMWVNKVTNTVYVLTSYLNGLPIWTVTSGAIAGGLHWQTDGAAALPTFTNNGYILTNAAGITATLPLVSAIGDQLWLLTTDSAAGSLNITQGAAQLITYNNQTTAAGAGTKCTITGLLPKQVVLQLICTVENTTWAIVNSNVVPNIV